MPHAVHVVALASALLSAGATMFIRHGLRTSRLYTGYWINLVVGAVVLWTAVALNGGVGPFSARSLAFFALSGLIGTVGGRLLRFASIHSVGPSISASLTNLHPLVSAGLAIALLGERVTLPIVVGIVVIVLGTSLLSGGGRRVGFRPWQLGVPIVSAVCFGVASVLRKVGVSDTGAITGSAVNVTAALIGFTAFLLASGQREAMTWRTGSLPVFLAAGVAENGSVFLNVVALTMGAVTVVVPLYSTSPVFVLLLSFVFLRGAETPTARVAAGTVLIVLGVYLITALSGH